MLLVRPYPVSAIAEARMAISDAATGQIGAMQRLYATARDALLELDPDEVEDWCLSHEAAAHSDGAAARAAMAVAEAWEGVVSVGATIADPRRFRGFAWLAAHARYADQGVRVRPSTFGKLADGGLLPGLSPEDSALFAALPALIGLGPGLPDELGGPCPLHGESVWKLLGLPEGDWEGIDPLDGVAVTPECCRGGYAALAPEWREVVGHCLEHGLLVREE